MLSISVKSCELFDEENNLFIPIKSTKLTLEHSLMSISKWEAKHHKTFLSDKEKTPDELIDYIRCMTINHDVDDNVYLALSEDNLKEVEEYIGEPMTSIVFPEDKDPNRQQTGHRNGDALTNEVIYYYMLQLGIPFECDKWHISRLMNLIRVCAIKNGKPQKMSQRDLLNRNAAINRQRRAKKPRRK